METLQMPTGEGPRRGAFAAALDASWAAFRHQLLEAYDSAQRHSISQPPEVNGVSSSSGLLPSPKSPESPRDEPGIPRTLQADFMLPLPLPAFRPTNHEDEALKDQQEDPLWSPRTNPSNNSPPLSDGEATARPKRPSRPSLIEKIGRENDSELAVSLQESLKLFETDDAEDTTPAGSTPHAPEVPLAAQERLQVRLGALSQSKLITGAELHQTVTALGLTSFTEQDMDTMLNFLGDYIDLDFPYPIEPPSDAKNFQHAKSSSGAFMRKLTSDTKKKRNSKQAHAATGPPVWDWPRWQPQPVARRMSQMGRASISGRASVAQKMGRASVALPSEPYRNYNTIPFKALVLAFHMDETEVQRRVFASPKVFQQFQAVKEILLAGDPNRLVAELTFVRINDLAAPPDEIDVLLYLEPLVALTIVANGIMIGFQSYEENQDWHGWIWFEVGFATVLILECCLRNFVGGCRTYFCGVERIWNWCDCLFIATAVTDLVLEAATAGASNMFFATLLRFARLVRLTRIVKVFRLHWMKELRLMLKGLVGSMQTLLMAFVLLFVVLYVLAGLATFTLGRDQVVVEMGYKELFENLPQSMFTAFRCFTSQCDENTGAPLPSLLASRLGLPFIIPYIFSYMLVTLGIFNVILAVYVDITMRAAKENEATTAEQHARESVRIARTARELLKKFAAANKIFKERDANSDCDGADSRPTSRASVAGKMDLDLSPASTHFTDQAMQQEIEITKELFLLVIQDPGVQVLMDDLDLPADRANLFEVIDADGSGTLHVSELVQGLLKVRGELKKSDAVAGLLATQSLQHTVTMRDFLQSVLLKLPDSPRGTQLGPLNRICE